MLIAAQLVAGLAAVLHVVFFVFESLLWTRPEVYARFGIGSREQAETIRPMAFNQGFYNLALAVGLFVGIVMLGRDGAAGVVGKTLVIFATACMVVAGVVLAWCPLRSGRHRCALPPPRPVTRERSSR